MKRESNEIFSFPLACPIKTGPKDSGYLPVRPGGLLACPAPGEY